MNPSKLGGTTGTIPMVAEPQGRPTVQVTPNPLPTTTGFPPARQTPLQREQVLTDSLNANEDLARQQRTSPFRSDTGRSSFDRRDGHSRDSRDYDRHRGRNYERGDYGGRSNERRDYDREGGRDYERRSAREYGRRGEDRPKAEKEERSRSRSPERSKRSRSRSPLQKRPLKKQETIATNDPRASRKLERQPTARPTAPLRQPAPPPAPLLTNPVGTLVERPEGAIRLYPPTPHKTTATIDELSGTHRSVAKTFDDGRRVSDTTEMLVRDPSKVNAFTTIKVFNSSPPGRPDDPPQLYSMNNRRVKAMHDAQAQLSSGRNPQSLPPVPIEWATEKDVQYAIRAGKFTNGGGPVGFHNFNTQVQRSVVLRDAAPATPTAQPTTKQVSNALNDADALAKLFNL